MPRMPTLVPFRAEHLFVFVYKNKDFVETIQNAVEKERRSVAFSAVHEGKIIGCAGILLAWPGVGSAWTVFSKELLEQFPIWTTRIIKRMMHDIIRNHNLHRVEMVAVQNEDMNIRWARTLGFIREREGIARKYLSSGDDVVRFEWVRS